MKLYSEEEACVAQFSAFLFKNNKTYLLSYLNQLIHGLKSACRHFGWYVCFAKEGHSYLQEENDYQSIFEKVEQHVNAEPDKLKEYPELTPELLTFRIGDLLRCKCSSKENEIVALYKEI